MEASASGKYHPFLYYEQQQLEIDNMKGGVLQRFYSSPEYMKLTDDLLNELALSLRETLDKKHTGSALVGCVT